MESQFWELYDLLIVTPYKNQVFPNYKLVYAERGTKYRYLTWFVRSFSVDLLSRDPRSIVLLCLSMHPGKAKPWSRSERWSVWAQAQTPASHAFLLFRPRSLSAPPNEHLHWIMFLGISLPLDLIYKINMEGKKILSPRCLWNFTETIVVKFLTPSTLPEHVQ